MPATAPLDRELRVETPEHVTVSYRLADLGSRFAALLVDGLIMGGVLLVLWIALPIAALATHAVPKSLAGVALGALVLASFFLVWGYFVYFEGLRDGQTPGKRRLGLRVVLDGGYPLTLRAAAVRNLLRIIDILPPPTWLVGGTVMMLNSQTKRLGDLAAGTVVVRERTEAALAEPLQPEDEESAAPRLTEPEFAALGRYVARRESLEPEARARLAGQLLERLAPRLGEDEARRHHSADGYLLRVHASEARRRAGQGGVAVGESAQAAALVRRQHGSWARYRQLLGGAGKRGLQALPEQDVSRFVALYRETSADLARARSYGASPEVVYSLERWVGAGHNLLYRPGARSWRQARRFLAGGFPALVRRRWRPIVLAAALLYLPLLTTAGAIAREPARARQVLPAQMIARAEEGAQRQQAGKGYVEIPKLFMPTMASAIIANNVQATFLAFAGGVLAGLGTVLVLVSNGVQIGATIGLFLAEGLGGYLFAFILPHGVIELTAICIAGGAGLWLGSALWLPGRRTRREVLVERGREAVALLAGTAVLLLIAGTLEGFVSPAHLPFALKAAISATTALLLALYLLLAGRGSELPDHSDLGL